MLGGLRLDPDSATLVLEFWLGKNSEEESNSMRKFIWKVTEVEEVSSRRNGLWKQVTEANEGPSELRRAQGKRNLPGGKRWGMGKCEPAPEGGLTLSSPS